MRRLRRWLIPILFAVSFAGSVWAQGGLNGGATMTCFLTEAAPTVRAEGTSELVGDMLLTCSGGSALSYGQQIPQANITIFVNTMITSRLAQGGNASEALLIVDEPGSSTVSSYGSGLPQIPCATPLTGCVEYVSNIGANPGVPSSTQPPAAGVAAPNVFQGVVSGNAVTFYGVPILPPATTGSRIFRITNVRADANGAAPVGQITFSFSVSPSTALSINTAGGQAAVVSHGMNTSLRSSTNQCGGGISGSAAVLRYSENFPSAFKTRTALVNGNNSPTSGFTGQNTPGQNYFTSDSGFTVPGITISGQTAGLADWGTRLKAVFTNVPSGVSVFVSTKNVADLMTAAPGGTGNPAAVLLTGETIAYDANGALAAGTVTQGNVQYVQVPIVNGTGIAVWEVTGNSNGFTTLQNMDFGVYTSSAAGSMSVSMSYAPDPTNGAIPVGPTGSNVIPRFASSSTTALFGSLASCATPTSLSISGPSTADSGQAVVFTATVQNAGSPSTPVTTGTITITDVTTNTALLGPTVPDANGRVSVTVSNLPVGVRNIQALYSPSAGLAASAASTSITVSSQLAMTCSASSAFTPFVRAEGFTEAVGDITIVCVNGRALQVGTQIPQANLKVVLNTQATSRMWNGASEALLLIDEPGSTSVVGYGSALAKIPCATPLAGCAAYVNNVPAQNGAPAATGVPVTAAGGTTPAPNVYQGVVSGNTVTFYGVPILPPGNTGARVYRITNLRANANALPLNITCTQGQCGEVTASVSIAPVGTFTVTQTRNPVAVVEPGLSTGLRNGSNTGSGSAASLSQCSIGSVGPNGAGILRFAENFPTAFKTRAALVNGNTDPLAAATGQNNPGQIYNSESNFTVASISSGGLIAGLSDSGTRVKAVFTNVPNGAGIYVSATNVANLTTAAPTGTGQATAALLTGESVSDGSGAFVPAGGGITVGNVSYFPVTIVNGTGVAVWEVTGNNYTANQNLDFGVYLSYTSGGVLPGTISVAMSYAPGPSDGAFSAAGAADPTQVNIIPRFSDTATATTLATIASCGSSILTKTAVTGPATSIYGQSATFTATAQSTGTPSFAATIGTVTITDTTTGATLLAGAVPNVIGQVAVSVSNLAAGNHLIQATYSGGSGFAGSTSSPWTINVGKATLAVSANNTSKVFGSTLPAFGATITGFANGDAAAVISGSPLLSTAATAASAVGTYPILAGVGTLSAANYTFSFVNGTLSVTKAATFTVLSGSGGALVASVAAVAPGAGTPTGTVQLLRGGTILGTQTLTGGSATFSSSADAVSAVYSGDGNFTGSTSATVSGPTATTSVSVTSSANPSTLGQAVTFSVSISGSGSKPPTGAVQFADGGKTLGSSLISGGQASFTTSSLPGGYHIISAQYGGDSVYSAAQGTCAQTVSAPISMTITANPSTPAFGQTVTLTASVTATTPPEFQGPTGQVTFQDAAATPFGANTTLGAAPLASGSASITVSTLAAGSHSIIAVYGGDATWPSLSRSTALAVSPAATTTSLSLSLNSSGQAVLTASVAPVAAGGAVPTGNVEFVDVSSNRRLLAIAALSSGSAAAAVPVAMLSRAIAATYSGDADYAASTSAPLPVAINSAANRTDGFAPDETASLFNIAGLTGDTVGTLPLTTSLGGVMVTLTDSAGAVHAAPLYGVFGSVGQINFVIPGDTALGTALVTVTLPGGSKQSTLVLISKSAAGVFTANMDGQGVFAGQVVHVHANGTQTVTNPAELSAPDQTYVPVPIDLGPPDDQVVVVLYGTGFRHAGSLTAAVNGVPLPILFYGAQGQYAGLDQINLALPRSLAGTGPAELVITADSRAANSVSLAIQ